MSRLKEIRQMAGLSQEEMRGSLAYYGHRMDAGLYSRMENDACLPTPPCADAICEILGMGLLEIYDPEELDFGVHKEAEKPQAKNKPFGAIKRHEGRTERKVQFRLLASHLQVLTSDILMACGYKTKTEWFHECVRQLRDKYQEIQKTAPVDEATEGGKVEQGIA